MHHLQHHKRSLDDTDYQQQNMRKRHSKSESKAYIYGSKNIFRKTRDPSLYKLNDVSSSLLWRILRNRIFEIDIIFGSFQQQFQYIYNSIFLNLYYFYLQSVTIYIFTICIFMRIFTLLLH